MPLFEVSGLTHFFGGLKAVSDFNLAFEGGELMGLIGPNGAGKTTIFNLICGVYHPTQGEVRIDGQSLVGLFPHQVTAFVATIFPSTFRDLIAFGVLLLILTLRPTGIFGVASRTKV